jgi:hypothetical protein
MSKKFQIFGTVLFLAMFSVYGYAKNDDPSGPPKPDDNPHPEDNIGVSHGDDCPGGGLVGIGGTINASSGQFNVTVRNDDCVHEVEVQPGDDKKVNGNVTTSGTVSFSGPTTVSLNMTTHFDNVTLTNAQNNVTLTCTQTTVGEFHLDSNVLDATSVHVVCDGSGQVQKHRLDDVVLDVFPHL